MTAQWNTYHSFLLSVTFAYNFPLALLLLIGFSSLMLASYPVKKSRLNKFSNNSSCISTFNFSEQRGIINLDACCKSNKYQQRLENQKSAICIFFLTQNPSVCLIFVLETHFKCQFKAIYTFLFTLTPKRRTLQSAGHICWSSHQIVSSKISMQLYDCTNQNHEHLSSAFATHSAS